MIGSLYLIQIFLPVKYNSGKTIPKSQFLKVKTQLIEKFGGLTAFTQAPAEGFWEKDSKMAYDKILLLEVMVKKIQKKWWSQYRQTLETTFQQEQIIVRCQKIRIL